MDFDPEHPLDQLRPADYNPRRISDSGFARLRESMRLFGCLKPVILNGDGTLVAGHQRTKALKANQATTVPAVKLSVKVAMQDEVKFNLLHNRIETSRSQAATSQPGPVGWDVLDPAALTVQKGERSGNYITSVCDLLARYGDWGSVVITEEGEVIANTEYAIGCKLMRRPLLAYRIATWQAEDFLAYLDGDYGVYDFGALGVKAYNQHNCQMRRLSGTGQLQSTLYEKHVLPALTAGERIMDFGAGLGAYASRINAEGNARVTCYEPHIKGKGGLDVQAVVGQLHTLHGELRDHGLFDRVVLDSVLNSVTSLQFEHHVLTMCNALLKPEGVFHTGTRNLAFIKGREELHKARSSNARNLEFLDADNFSATFRNGVWTLQRFHDKDSLRELLLDYFVEVRVTGSGSQIYATCRQPRQLALSAYEKAAEVELNMEYPGGYHHHQHGPCIGALLQRVSTR